MTAYTDLEINQGEDWALQIIWTDDVNEPYQVCHPMRMQARSASGQTLIDVYSVDQTVTQPGGTSPTMVYSTEGGVVQVIIPNSVTDQLPSGVLFYDLYVSYISSGSSYLGEESDPVVRRFKLLQGKCIIEGRVTKNV